jgi:hypothetical protein
VSVVERGFFFESVYVTFTLHTPAAVVFTCVFVTEHARTLAFFGTTNATLVTFFKPSSATARFVEIVVFTFVVGL